MVNLSEILQKQMVYVIAMLLVFIKKNQEKYGLVRAMVYVIMTVKHLHHSQMMERVLETFDL